MHPQMLLRQLDVLPIHNLGEKITIIGAGSVGSFTALALAKMGFSNITVYDDDKIETENMNCQFYPLRSIGQLKVDALHELVKDFADIEIEKKAERYADGTFPGIVISAVDNMAVRKKIWDEHKANGAVTRAVLDPRMGAEAALLYTMNPTCEKDIESYEKTLYTDDDAVVARCTEKSTMYCVLLLSGLVSTTVKALVTNNKYPRVSQWDMKGLQFQTWSN